MLISLSLQYGQTIQILWVIKERQPAFQITVASGKLVWVALSAEMDPLDFHSPLHQPLSLAGKPLAANQEANHHVSFRGRTRGQNLQTWISSNFGEPNRMQHGTREAPKTHAKCECHGLMNGPDQYLLNEGINHKQINEIYCSGICIFQASLYS